MPDREDDLRSYDPDTGVRYRWVMPDSRRGYVIEIEDDSDGPIVAACVTGPGYTRPAAFAEPDELRWLAEQMPQILAAVDVYEMRARTKAGQQ